MTKAGLIGAGVGLVLALVGTFVFPLLCNPCAAVFVGLGAGALAGVFTRPQNGGTGAADGAKAGAIATAGNLIGQMVGAGVNVLLVGPETFAELAAQMSRQFGLGPIDPEMYARLYLPVSLLGNCACGMIGVALGAGLGAVGGLLWYQFSRQGSALEEPFEVFGDRGS